MAISDDLSSEIPATCAPAPSAVFQSAGGQLEFIPGFFLNLTGFGSLVAPNSRLVFTASSFSIEKALSERDQTGSPSGSFGIFWLFIMKNSVCSSVEPDSAMVVIM
nr:hypothetical protein Iba_chr12fCG6530 [Ipomoea batatas]